MPNRPPALDTRSRVLIVEDDEDTGAMLSSMLEDRGYAVKWAQHGEEGLRHCIASALSGRPPHLVLLDLRLPDMDGADLAHSLARSMMGAPPIIVLSALPSRLIEEAARSIGARAAMRKPFDVQRLLESIAAAIASKSELAALIPLIAPAAPTAESARAAISHDLRAAIDTLQAHLPELSSHRGGIAESLGWIAAHRVVGGAMEELGAKRIAELGFDVALAQCAYLAASDAQAAFNQAKIVRGAAPLDFALADSYGYSLLHLAIALGRALAPDRTPAAGSA